MIEFEIKDKKFNMASSWEEITLGMYMEINKLQRKDKLLEMKELFILKLMGVLSGATEKELNKLTLQQLGSIMENLKFLEAIPEFPKKDIFVIGEEVYSFPTNINLISMGEYVSVKVACEGLSEVEMLPKILSIICRPSIKDGDKYVQCEFDDDYIQTLEAKEEMFLTQKVMDVMGGVNFFLSGKN